VLVDGDLLPQGEVFSHQAEAGYEERSDEEIDGLADGHEKVSQG